MTTTKRYILTLRKVSRAERIRLYRVAEEIPLSDRQAGHILARLKRRAA